MEYHSHMLILLVSIFVPVFIFAVLPLALEKLLGRPIGDRALLGLACLLYAIAWYLPSPPIQGQHTAATTHFIGGGIFSGLLWLYLIRQLRWRAPLLIRLASLFAFVSTLGVLNELAELLAVQAGLADLTLADTSWDLVMNTAGVALFMVLYALSKTRPQANNSP